LQESIRGPEDTSLEWPDFLRFRVLEDTTPFHNWKNLYQVQRNGKRPIMRDCYVTAGWDNRSKLPLWLPCSAQDPGTLQALIETWFPTIKDKLTIIFEYIYMDIKASACLSPDIPILKSPANPEVGDSLSLSQLNSSRSGQFSSSPPILTTIPTQAIRQQKGEHNSMALNHGEFTGHSHRISSESSLISLRELISQGQRKNRASILDIDPVPMTIDEPVFYQPDNISANPASCPPSTSSFPHSGLNPFTTVAADSSPLSEDLNFQTPSSTHPQDLTHLSSLGIPLIPFDHYCQLPFL